MPNWCFNHLTIEKGKDGKGEEVEKIIASLLSKDDKGEIFFDFNKIIPMPKSLEVVSGSETLNAIRYMLFKEIDNITTEQRKKIIGCLREWEVEKIASDNQETIGEIEKKYKDETELKKFKKYGKTLISNIKKYGCPTWYEWCVKNWGTKWNGCDSWLEDDILHFDTAWSPPIPVLIALSKKYPNNEFYLEFEDECEEGLKQIAFINGETYGYNIIDEE